MESNAPAASVVSANPVFRVALWVLICEIAMNKE
jgi:hypothetical protein